MPQSSDNAEHMRGMADLLFQAARDEYKFFTLEMKNRQTTIQNMYFWIASALFTVYGAAFRGMFIGKDFLHLGMMKAIPDPWYLHLHQAVVFMAFTLCACVVLTGVDALRGRGATNHFLGGNTALSMLESYLATANLSHMDAIRDLLKECEKNTAYNAGECKRMGKHLRHSSLALVWAIFCGLLAFVM